MKDKLLKSGIQEENPQNYNNSVDSVQSTEIQQL